MATVSDRKLPESPTGGSSLISGFKADVRSASDYYPFGMMMPGRSYFSGDYRFAFQGQEQDNEIKGEGNSVNFKYRMHDSRIGRFFAVDPLASKYPHYTPYSFSGNKVIAFIELEGLEEKETPDKKEEELDLEEEEEEEYYEPQDPRRTGNTGPWTSQELFDKFFTSYTEFIKHEGSDKVEIPIDPASDDLFDKYAKLLMNEYKWNKILVDEFPDNSGRREPLGVAKISLLKVHGFMYNVETGETSEPFTVVNQLVVPYAGVEGYNVFTFGLTSLDISPSLNLVKTFESTNNQSLQIHVVKTEFQIEYPF